LNPEVDLYHKNTDGTTMLDLFGEPMPEDHTATTNEKMIGKIRKLSVTISLNEPTEYKGGNLRFDLGPHRPDRYHTCKEIRPRGSVVVFPSHIQHQVTPVTFGTRYSLVAWNLGKPFR
jgi:PKHD-type hydroxylase